MVAKEPKDDLKELDVSGLREYKLLKPVTINGVEFKNLTLDFDSLTGADLEDLASIRGSIPNDGSTSEYSKTYLANVAARAAKINVNELRGFSAPDYTAITMLAYGFLTQGLGQFAPQ